MMAAPKKSKPDPSEALAKADPKVGELERRVQLLEKQNAKLKREAAQAKEFQTIAEQQQEHLEKLRSSKWKLPTGKRHSSGGAYVRVVIPDTHGSHMDKAAIKAFLGDLEAFDARQVVMLGDHLDCGGFLAQKFTMGYVAETSYTFEDDVNATNQLLDSITELCPRAEIHYLQGNHERRIENWCVTQALRNGTDAKFLLSMFSTDKLLSLTKRGIKEYKQGETYGDCHLPATLQLGHCYFTHGVYTNKHAAKSHLEEFGANVVFGHTHRADMYAKRTVKQGVIRAWNPGCLCVLQKYWHHQRNSNWNHGYAIQTVQDSGDFLHINVPIIDGRSYLVQLTEGAA